MPANAKQNNARLFLFSFTLFQTESLGWMEKLKTELNQGQRFSDEKDHSLETNDRAPNCQYFSKLIFRGRLRLLGNSV